MKIAITARSFGKLDPAPLELLRGKFSEIAMNETGGKLDEAGCVELLNGAAGVLAGTEKLSEAVFAACPDLRVISRVGVGLDSVDLEAARKRGIKVLNTPGVLADAVAELTLALILDCLRKVSASDRAVRAGEWKAAMGSLLRGKTVGIIGLGANGRRLAELLAPFKVSLVACDVAPDRDFADRHGVLLTDIETLLLKSDVVSVNAPLTGGTRHLLDAARLAMMKEGAVLVNASRGGIVDDGALCEALKSGRLAAAGLDVFEKEPYTGELARMDNVVLTPHIGSYAREARVAMEWAAAKNLVGALDA